MSKSGRPKHFQEPFAITLSLEREDADRLMEAAKQRGIARNRMIENILLNFLDLEAGNLRLVKIADDTQDRILRAYCEDRMAVIDALYSLRSGIIAEGKEPSE